MNDEVPPSGIIIEDTRVYTELKTKSVFYFRPDNQRFPPSRKSYPSKPDRVIQAPPS